MPRNLLDEASIHPAVRGKVDNWQHGIIDEVKAAVAANDVVVVGMAQNPFPAKARKALDAAGIAHKYISYGSYFSLWRARGAVKMWSGWPTFPMVFVKGTLIGGYDDLKALMENGELKTMIARR